MSSTPSQPAGRVTAHVVGPVGYLVFDNPGRRNAISLEMWVDLVEALSSFSAQSSIRMVVMSGAGEKAFVSGADISQFADKRHDAQSAEEYTRASNAGWEMLARFEKPLIAAIQGFCIGGGLSIAMKADLRIATGDSTFGVPAARLGIAYPEKSIRDLVNLVGPSWAKEILFTGRRLNADEALSAGLVSRVVPPGELDAAVGELASTIVENAPLSILAAKVAVDHITRGDFSQAHIESLVLDCFNSRDFSEGRAAFMEKRPPQFEGR